MWLLLLVPVTLVLLFLLLVGNPAAIVTSRVIVNDTTDPDGIVECKWQCDDPVCNQRCDAVCQDPVCTFTQDGKTIEQPDGMTCEIVCPTNQMAGENCPACSIQCSEVEGVEATCQPTNCNWSCPAVDKSKCTKPQCELVCPQASCLAP